jgi:hypothetical protein
MKAVFAGKRSIKRWGVTLLHLIRGLEALPVIKHFTQKVK